MRFKGSFAKGFLVALILTLIPFTAFSAQKITSGSTCKVLKQKAVYQNKTYTCIKSGKKLVWNKGVAVKKPTLTPAPTPAPTSTPIPTPTPTQSVKPVIVNEIAKKAFELIQSAKGQNTNLVLTYQVGKSIPSDLAEVVKRNVESASRIYSRFLDSSRPVIIHIYSEKDLPSMVDRSIFYNRQDLQFFADWWEKDPSTLNSSFGYPGSFLKDDCSLSIPNQCIFRSGHAGVAYPSRATVKTLDLFNLAVAPHELFHVIQDFYRYKGEPAYYVTEEVKDISMPSIFREGGATFMEMAGSYEDFEQYESVFKIAKKWMMSEYSKEINALSTPEDVSSLMVKLEKGDRSPRSYALGAVFHEWLLTSYGLDKFVSLTKSHSIEKQFTQVFSEIYGMTLVEAYTKAAPHILVRIKD